MTVQQLGALLSTLPPDHEVRLMEGRRQLTVDAHQWTFPDTKKIIEIAVVEV